MTGSTGITSSQNSRGDWTFSKSQTESSHDGGYMGSVSASQSGLAATCVTFRGAATGNEPVAPVALCCCLYGLAQKLTYV